MPDNTYLQYQPRTMPACLTHSSSNTVVRVLSRIQAYSHAMSYSAAANQNGGRNRRGTLRPCGHALLLTPRVPVLIGRCDIPLGQTSYWEIRAIERGLHRPLEGSMGRDGLICFFGIDIGGYLKTDLFLLLIFVLSDLDGVFRHAPLPSPCPPFAKTVCWSFSSTSVAPGVLCTQLRHS